VGVLSDAPKPYDWDALARAWADTRPQELWRRHSDWVYADLLRRWLPGSLHSVLKTDAFDEAVSEGVYPDLSRCAGAVVSIDVAPTALTRARERHRALLCACADVRRLPFADAAFDGVVSLSTLDHFDSHEDIETALAEIVRVLRPGGTLILTLDNLLNPVIALRALLPFRLLHAIGVLPYQVGRTCGPRRLRHFITRAGLEVAETSAVVHCPRVLAVALAALLERNATPRLQEAFLHAAGRMERLRTLPTRFVTGHFVAVRALKPSRSGR
jgi:ubiquinone/menaquinone biosynthesis C-methylase UbiE